MRIFVSLVLGLMCRCALAASGDDGIFKPNELLSGSRLADLAVERNAGLQGASARVTEMQAREVPAGRLDDPEISYSMAPQTVGGYRLGDGSRRDLNQRTEVEQMLPWPGKLGLKQGMAHQAFRAQQAEAAEQALTLQSRAKSLYARWRYVHRALNFNAEQQELFERLKAASRTRYAAGLTRQQPILEAERERLNLEEQALGIQREQRELHARINALLNREMEAIVPPPEQNEIALIDPDTMRTPGDTLHPHLRALQAEVDSGQLEADLARKNSLPDLKVSAAYDSFWDAEAQRWNVGVAINLPWDRTKYRALEDAAEAKKEASRWRLIDAHAQLKADLENARAMASESYQAIALYRGRLLPLAKTAAESALEGYRSGSGTFADVLSAERDKLDTELKLATLEADYLSRMAESERLLGGGIRDAAVEGTSQ